MWNLWDNNIWDDEQEYRQKEEAHREYTPDTEDLDIMEWY